MSSVRWDPFRDLLSLQERMNNLFEESLGRTTDSSTRVTEGTWSPPVDILEKEDEIILKAEVPGVKLDDVTLEIKNDVLTLTGTRHLGQKNQQENYHRIERSYGNFSRSFLLPGIVDMSKIQAKLKDGLLEVRLPKAKSSRAQPIPIEIRKT